MRLYCYAVQDEKGGCHVMRIPESENIAQLVRKLSLVVVRPCKTYAEAVHISQEWKAAKQ